MDKSGPGLQKNTNTLAAFTENVHITSPYRAVINNKKELEVFWFVENTLEDKKNEVD